jgi:hypothetical protein
MHYQRRSVMGICATCGAIDSLRDDKGECGRCVEIRDPAQRWIYLTFARILNRRRPLARGALASLLSAVMFGPLAAVVFLMHHLVLLHRTDHVLAEAAHGAALGAALGVVLDLWQWRRCCASR